jgi:hypothetical protein
MSPGPNEPSPALIPLYVNVVIAASIGVIFLFAGSESALLILFMLGLIFLYGLIFGVCTLLMGRTAVTTRDPMLATVVAASVSYIAIWIYAAMSGEISHNSRLFLAAFLSSFVYAGLALILASRIKKPRE